MITARESKYFRDMIGESKYILDGLGIEYSGRITYETFNSARSWGRCTKTGKASYNIKINECLVKSGNNIAMLNTIIHEILHTTKGGMKHTGNWLRYAKKVNKNFPELSITRLSSYDIEKAKPKYIITCLNCGQIYKYYRKSTIVKKIMAGTPNLCTCGVCHRRLTRDTVKVCR